VPGDGLDLLGRATERRARGTDSTGALIPSVQFDSVAAELSAS
jgi:hypothetical protein